MRVMRYGLGLGLGSGSGLGLGLVSSISRTRTRGADADAKLDERALGPVVWQHAWRHVPEDGDAPHQPCDAREEEGQAARHHDAQEAAEAVHARGQVAAAEAGDGDDDEYVLRRVGDALLVRVRVWVRVRVRVRTLSRPRPG